MYTCTHDVALLLKGNVSLFRCLVVSRSNLGRGCLLSRNVTLLHVCDMYDYATFYDDSVSWLNVSHF